MSEFLEFLDGFDEPISVDDVKRNCRIDEDITDDDTFIQEIIIPGARQMAETRTGSIIRPARFVQRFPRFPESGRDFPITHGLVKEIESISFLPLRGSPRIQLSQDAYESFVIDRETLVCPLTRDWPETGISPRAVEIVYTAGVGKDDFSSRFPSVKQWLLLAATWAYDHRSLFVTAKGAHGYQELPDDYVSCLLDPITLATRF